MKRNRVKQDVRVFVFCMILAGGSFVPRKQCRAQEKQYGILIADTKGAYTFYDLNLAGSNQCIEAVSQKQIMIPLKKVCGYIPSLAYSFDFSTRTATIVNQKTGNTLTIKENQKYGVLYTKGSRKGKKVTFAKAGYISDTSKALMVHSSVLKHILKSSNGYCFYNQKAMKKAGYDSSLFQGIVVYNPYGKVSQLPKAVQVSYSSQRLADYVVKVTIPEGYSVAQTIERLVQSGVCVSSDAVYQAMERVNLNDYAMFEGRVIDETVCFALEGYLFPDTYEFYRNSSPAEVVSSILKHSDMKLRPYIKHAEEKGYTLNDILCMASVIEKETGASSEMPKISSVLHTRLNRGMKIQCDCTIHYVERYIKPYITGDKNRYNSYYNTYKCKALPAGPICTPGERAIKAALNPDKTEYLYFATDKAGIYYYASNDEEWLAMKEAIERSNAELNEEE